MLKSILTERYRNDKYVFWLIFMGLIIESIQHLVVDHVSYTTYWLLHFNMALMFSQFIAYWCKTRVSIRLFVFLCFVVVSMVLDVLYLTHNDYYYALREFRSGEGFSFKNVYRAFELLVLIDVFIRPAIVHLLGPILAGSGLARAFSLYLDAARSSCGTGSEAWYFPDKVKKFFS